MTREVEQMIIRHDLKIALLHVPKCGGKRLRNIFRIGASEENMTELWNYEYNNLLCRYVDKAHMPISDLKTTEYYRYIQEYKVIGCCRNPYARLRSASNEYYRQKNKQTEEIIKSRGSSHEMRRKYNRVLERMHSCLDPRYIHSLPIVRFTHEGEQPICDHILRCENLRDDFLKTSKILNLPEAIIGEAAKVLDNRDEKELRAEMKEEEYRLAEKLYEADFKTFNYEMLNRAQDSGEESEAGSIRDIHNKRKVVWHWGPSAEKPANHGYKRERNIKN